jgi:hypothetical protein
LTQGDTPWNPSSFSDQVAGKFYQQVIDNCDTNVKGKYANLVFHLDNIVMKNANDIDQLNKD